MIRYHVLRVCTLVLRGVQDKILCAYWGVRDVADSMGDYARDIGIQAADKRRFAALRHLHLIECELDAADGDHTASASLLAVLEDEEDAAYNALDAAHDLYDKIDREVL